jgi:hypothetical protein
LVIGDSGHDFVSLVVSYLEDLVGWIVRRWMLDKAQQHRADP